MNCFFVLLFIGFCCAMESNPKGYIPFNGSSEECVIIVMVNTFIALDKCKEPKDERQNLLEKQDGTRKRFLVRSNSA